MKTKLIAAISNAKEDSSIVMTHSLFSKVIREPLALPIIASLVNSDKLEVQVIRHSPSGAAYSSLSGAYVARTMVRQGM